MSILQGSTEQLLFEKIREFKGHSGCDIALCRRGDQYFVRKQSGTRNYNLRFAEQIKKQIDLATIISMPKVLRYDLEDELVSAEMEYVRGDDFRSYATQQTMQGMGEFIEKIIEPISVLATTGSGNVAQQEFIGKLDELGHTVPRSQFFTSHSRFIESLIERLRDMSWDAIPQSKCHGDLTLENILIRSDGSMVFIDPLDGPMSSVWLDVAKLVQDLTSGWSLRTLLWNSETTPESRLLAMLTRYLSEELQSRVRTTFPGIEYKLSQLRALQALRVLPYVQDVRTFAHVIDGLKRIEF